MRETSVSRKGTCKRLTLAGMFFIVSALCGRPLAAAEHSIFVQDNITGRSVRALPDEVVVKFKKNVSERVQRDLVGKHSSVFIRETRVAIQRGAARVVRKPEGKALDKFVQELRKEDSVLYAEPNYIAKTLAVPNDPLYKSQWGLPLIHAPEAWNVTLGNPSIVVAVVDTGIDLDHPDLRENFVTGYDFVNNDPVPEDDNGHGTYCAGIIAARGNNGIGITGVAPRCSLMPLKALDAIGEGSYVEIADALYYAADHGARVISMSIGGDAYSFLLQEAVDYAQSKGCVIVAAGGNSGAETAIYPAAFQDVIGVAAMGLDQGIWPGSSRGPHIDIAAPGESVISTARNGAYQEATGTSAATPFVAGAVAILMANAPELLGSVLVQNMLKTVRDFGTADADISWGKGLLDLAGALTVPSAAFHDLSIGSISLTSERLSPESTASVAVEVVNSGTVVSESGDLTIQINGESQTSSVTVAGKTVVSREIPRNADLKKLVIVATIAASGDQDVQNNRKEKIYFGDEDPGSSAWTLYGQDAHMWMAGEAYYVWPFGKNSAAANELSGYVGEVGFLSGNYSRSKAIINGAYTEDSGFPIQDNPFNDFMPYLRHFWNTGSLDSSATPGLGGLNDARSYAACGGICDSAANRACKYWSGGYDCTGTFFDQKWSERGIQGKGVIQLYLDGTVESKALSFKYLGHIAHLLADMGLPAHVLNDPHGPDPLGGIDRYEEYVSQASVFCDIACDGSPDNEMNFQRHGEHGCRKVRGNAPVAMNLVDLFRRMADYGDDFESDDRNGGNDEEAQLDHDGAWVKHAGQALSDQCSTNVDECKAHQDSLEPEVIRRIAALYMLFWEATHGNTPPEIYALFPAEQAVVTGNLVAHVNAYDNVGIQKVEYFLDYSLTPAYVATSGAGFPWQAGICLSNGNHYIKACAYDYTNRRTCSTTNKFVASGGTNTAPSAPSQLLVYGANGSTEIPQGGMVTGERAVVIGGVSSDADGDTFTIDVEMQQAGVVFAGQSSTPYCSHQQPVASGQQARTTCSGMSDKAYHLQVRSRDSHGAPSDWVPLWVNSENEPDFTVAVGGELVNQPPSMSILSPNGGDALVAGSVQTVRWSARDDHGVQSVSIRYSINGGLTSTPVVSAIPNSGSYAWTVPGTLTNNALISITATDGSLSSTDWSNAPFSIVQSCTLPGSPELFDPGIWSVTGNYTINWAAGNASSYILQEATDPSFTSFIPYTADRTSKYIAGKGNGFYYYRLAGVNTCGQGPYSNVVDLEVRIPAPPDSATNPSPANGLTNVQRQNLALSWTPGANTSEVAICFEKNNPDPGSRVGFGAVTGASFILPETLDAGATYYWRIRSKASNGLITDSPVWSFSTEYTIADLTPSEFTFEGTLGPENPLGLNATIRNIGTFSSGGAKVYFYYSATPGGKDTLLNPGGTSVGPLIPGAETQIAVPATLDHMIAGQSYLVVWIDTHYFPDGNVDNNIFSKAVNYTDGSAPAITSLSLAPPVSFYRTRYQYNIVYSAKDDTGIENLDFSYSPDNGSTWQDIVRGYVPTGSIEYGSSYAWQIPVDCPLTTSLLIKITAWDTSGNNASRTAGPYVVRDGSAPTVTIVSPNGGEVWDMGSTHNIQWTLSAPNGVGNAHLSVYYDGTAEFLGNTTANTSGIFSWTLRNNFSTKTGKIRISIEDMNGNASEDWSDGYFEVRDTTLPPPAPWNAPEVVDAAVSLPPSTLTGTAVATDGNGDVHVVYSRYLDETFNSVRRITSTIFYRKKTTAGWSAPQTVFNRAQDILSSPEYWWDIRSPKIAVDSSNLPHVVWVSGSSGVSENGNENDIYHSYYNGSSWSQPEDISGSIRGPFSVARIAWSAKANLPVASQPGASAAYDGKLYVFGAQTFMTNYVFDPVGNSWSSIAGSPGSGVDEGGAAVLGSKIFVVGSPSTQARSELKIYDALATTWSTGASLPVYRRYANVVAANGFLYVIGGSDADSSKMNNVYQYDPTTTNWVERQPMPTARVGAVAAVVGGLVYVIGGDGDGGVLDKIEVYDPGANSWSTRSKPIAATWPKPAYATATVVDGKIFVVGGFIQPNASYQYDPQKNTWFSLKATPAGICNSAIGAIGTKIYLAGGACSGESASVLEGNVTNELTGVVSGSPDMTKDSLGNIHVIWADGGYYEADASQPLGYRWQGPNSLYHSVRLTSNTWTPPFMAVSTAGAPTISDDDSGNIHLAYMEGVSSLYYRTWNGSVWSGPQIISTPTAGSFSEPDMSVDGGGLPHIAWRYWDDSHAMSYVFYSARHSGTWSAPENVSPGGPNFEPSRPSMVNDAIGRPHVITEDNRGTPPVLSYQYRGVSAWSNRISLINASQIPSNYTSSISISPARDHIHVVTGSNKGLIYNHAVIPNTLDIIAPVVTINAPAVDEVVANGAPYQITWVVADDSPVATVKIEYSADGGNDYTILAGAAPNTGSYQWSVPSPEVAAAQLRITAVDPSDNTGMATSGAFSIKDNMPPQVSLLSPAGGENWDAGSQHDISWSATDNTGVTSVALYFSADGGTSWQSITSGLVGIGTYGWSIPYEFSSAVQVKAAAYDAGGLSSEVESSALTIVRPNTPPATPYNPLPADNQTDVSLDATIRWSSGDLDGDALMYTIFFGTNTDPPQVVTGVAGTSYLPSSLLEKTDYFWRIVVSDGKASASGPIWKLTTGAKPILAPTSLSAAVQSATQIDLSWNDNSDNEQGFSLERKIAPYGLYQVVASSGQNVTSFVDTTARGNTTYIYRVRAYNAVTFSGYSSEVSGTTMNTLPNQPSNPVPADTSSNQILRATLRWNGGDADLEDTLTYDIYFGRSTDAPLISEKQQDRQLPLGTLDPNSVYYWRVVAFDSHGDAAAGPWWIFVTGDRSPVITLGPDQLTFCAATGAGVVGPQELVISNSGGSVMQWELGADAGWLKSNPQGGEGDGQVQISADTAGLEAGTYQGNLTILAEGADNTPRVVPITLNLTTPVLFVVAPTQLTMGSAGDLGSISITTAAGCPWTAESNNGWMTITSGASGSGSGTVRFYVSPNANAPRTGTLTVAGTTVTVDQSAQAVRAEFVGIVDHVAYEKPYGPAPLEVTFDASSCSGQNPIVSYHWEFGDGQVADVLTTTVGHTYGSAGSYFVTLSITDSLGGTDSTQRLVSVAEVVQAVMSPAELQAALTVAAGNDKHDLIRLAGGVYALTGNSSAPFIYNSTENKELVIEGGWTPDFSQRAYNIPTELKNDIPAPSGGNGGVLGITSGGGVTVDGVTVSGGNTTGSGGGLYVSAVGPIVLGNSRVLGNTSTGLGGGLYVESSGGAIWLYGSTINGNNGASGGGGLIKGSSAYVYTNEVFGNTATSADGGLQASVNSDGELLISNNTIFGNQSDAGGSSLNVAVTGTGGVSLLDIHNNILLGNGTAPNLYVTPDCVAIASSVDLNIVNNVLGSSDVCPELLLDTSNINTDFSGHSAGNIRLSAEETALIDRGTAYSVPLEDFEGDSIPLDGDEDTNAMPDIGADEYNPANPVGPEAVSVSPPAPTIGTVGGSVMLSALLDHPAKRDLVLYLTHADTNTDSPGQPLVTVAPAYLKILKGATSAAATVQALGAARHGTALVTASDPSGKIGSGSVTVTMTNDTPSALTLIAPIGAIVIPTPTYTWNAQPGVDSYYLWVGTGSSSVISALYTAAAAGCGSGEATCFVTPAIPLAKGTWYFNVRGRNTAGTGPWATAKSFMVVTAPTAVTLVSPNGMIGTATPTYAWLAQAGATSYQLWVGTGTSTVHSMSYSAAAAGCVSGTGTCSVTPAKTLLVGVWYFNVKAKNVLGDGPWTTARCFIIGTPPTMLTLVSPTGPTGTATPTYAWLAQVGATSYQLWVGTGTSTVLSAWFTPAEAGCGAGELTCSLTPATSLAIGNWYFNVKGKNAAGTGPWATAKRFSVP